ncbi:MAG TPA: B12-binding domain-containing radical SAM protein [Nitrospirota bacterium]|nr:B12-binding domain-containing radical SAM protein [Nitrospirota bacterium]
MKILLVYPKSPTTFWSFKYALKFVSKKATLPPLGLLTVAAMLPASWNLRLVDMNVERLSENDLRWADFVFVSAMSIQKESVHGVISRCKTLGIKVIAGGPLFTSCPEEFDEVDHLVLNEAEITLPLFLEDLSKGNAGHIYTSPQWADMGVTPLPRYDLVNMKKYASMNVQYSRGCPFDCDFCNITVLYGRIPRTKTTEQLLAEFDALYALGWRYGVFIVDDNFIGNKGKLKREVLPAIIAWMEKRNHPFTLSTEVSINLADDDELLKLMSMAQFDTVFVGIESPNDESLAECSKLQNRNRDMIASVKKMQQHGLEVQAGFIVGFDKDPASIFERLIAFIQESGIVTAMVGLLNAPHGTKLYNRLKAEGRLVKSPTGDNTDFSINFIPKMNTEHLLTGYRKILDTIYSPKNFYARTKQFLKDYRPVHVVKFRLRISDFSTVIKSMVRLGVVGRERFQYWKLLLWSLLRRPRLLPLAITFSIYGHHFRKVFNKHQKALVTGPSHR